MLGLVAVNEFMYHRPLKGFAKLVGFRLFPIRCFARLVAVATQRLQHDLGVERDRAVVRRPAIQVFSMR